MRCPHNVFMHMANEADFTKTLSRDVCAIHEIFYHAFRWTPEFNEDEEPSMVSVWISLPSLPPNYYLVKFF